MDRESIKSIQFTVNRLIGDYSAVGETYHDEESIENLELVAEILYDITSKLLENAMKQNHYAFSIQKVAKESREILDELISYIQNQLKE